MLGKSIITAAVCLFVVISSTLIPSTSLAQTAVLFRIGTGSAGGTYFPIGGTIATGLSSPIGARPCNEGGQCGVPGMIAVAQSTTASVFNNQAVHNGNLEAGLAAADVTRAMYLGSGEFENVRYDSLRVIANLYPEDLHLVLPKGETIDSIADLRGKRVGIAESGSGTQVAVLQMLAAWGLSRDNIEAAELNSNDSALYLADGRIDAYFYAAGWPVPAISRLASTKGMNLHSFSKADLEIINGIIPSFISSKIPAGVYEGVDKETHTPAVSALLVMSSNLSEELAYGVTKALWNANTRKLLDEGHMKGKQITLENALRGIAETGVPLHRGALRYYKEIGKL